MESLSVKDLTNKPLEHQQAIRQLHKVIVEGKSPLTSTECLLVTDRVFLEGWDSNWHTRKYLARLPIENSFKLPDIVSDNKEWFNCNPSICANYDNDGYYILLRVINFSSYRATNYKSHSVDNKIKTRNLLLSVDKRFAMEDWKELQDQSNRTIYAKHVEGLEDMQIFKIKEIKRQNKGKRLGFFCTLVDCQKNGVPQIGFGTIALSSGTVTTANKLGAQENGNCEKNWLPYLAPEDGPGKISMLYNGAEMRRLQLDLNGGVDKNTYEQLKPIGSMSKIVQLRDTRGSGGPIAWKVSSGEAVANGWLILFHEVIWCENAQRTYTHRFVQTDKSFKPLRCSTAFTFSGRDVEFARSMIWDLDEKRVLIGAGIDDHTAWIFTINPKTIQEMLVFDL